MFTMGDVARRSVTYEDLLYKLFGKNAILKGMNLEEGATARKRNAQIAWHNAYIRRKWRKRM